MYHTGYFYVFLTLDNCYLVQEIIIVLSQLGNLGSQVELDAFLLLHALVEEMLITHETFHS